MSLLFGRIRRIYFETGPIETRSLRKHAAIGSLVPDTTSVTATCRPSGLL